MGPSVGVCSAINEGPVASRAHLFWCAEAQGDVLEGYLSGSTELVAGVRGPPRSQPTGHAGGTLSFQFVEVHNIEYNRVEAVAAVRLTVYQRVEARVGVWHIVGECV